VQDFVTFPNEVALDPVHMHHWMRYPMADALIGAIEPSTAGQTELPGAGGRAVFTNQSSPQA